jgi:hypothetical protein
MLEGGVSSDAALDSIFGGLVIMMGHHARSEALFYYFRLEDQVPENHLLRRIDKHVSFAFVGEQMKDSYSETLVFQYPRDLSPIPGGTDAARQLRVLDRKPRQPYSYYARNGVLEGGDYEDFSHCRSSCVCAFRLCDC